MNPAGEVYCWGEGEQPTRVTGLPAAASVEVGGATSCAVLRDGGVSCWGDEAGTDWGTGSDDPVRLGGLRDIVQVSLGLLQSTGCAVDLEGAVFCWGDNASGETGSGEATALPIARPVRVAGLDAARRVEVGTTNNGGGAGAQVCATMRTGEAYCWGDGLLSGPSYTVSSVPVQASALDDALHVFPAFQRVCARRYKDGNGNVTCWGTPALLGVGNDDHGPIRVTAAGHAAAISGGLYHTCTINGSQHLVCWGAATSPARVGASETYLSLDCVGNTAAALTVDGRLHVWNLTSANNPQLVEHLSLESLP